MKERPILFNGDMVRAILEGRKTQTRRVIHRDIVDCFDLETDGSVLAYYCPATGDSHPPTIAAPYQLGDLLWAREVWGSLNADHPRCPDGRKPQHGDRIVYRATDGYQWSPESEAPHTSFCWRSPIHMPRWASRITLRVTGVRVEQLRDITEEDARAEGVARLFSLHACQTTVGLIGTTPEDHGWTNYLWHGTDAPPSLIDAWPHQYSGYPDARGSFSSLWQLINAKPKPIYKDYKTMEIESYVSYPWADIQEMRTHRGLLWRVTGNPWVWVVGFEVAS